MQLFEFNSYGNTVHVTQRPHVRALGTAPRFTTFWPALFPLHEMIDLQETEIESTALFAVLSTTASRFATCPALHL